MKNDYRLLQLYVTHTENKHRYGRKTKVILRDRYAHNRIQWRHLTKRQSVKILPPNP